MMNGRTQRKLRLAAILAAVLLCAVATPAAAVTGADFDREVASLARVIEMKRSTPEFAAPDTWRYQEALGAEGRRGEPLELDSGSAWFTQYARQSIDTPSTDPMFQAQ